MSHFILICNGTPLTIRCNLYNYFSEILSRGWSYSVYVKVLLSWHILCWLHWFEEENNDAEIYVDGC
jgi:hypothetical protein